MLIVALRMAAVNADMHTQARSKPGASHNAPLSSTDSHSGESSLRTRQLLKPRSGRDEWVQTRVREVLEAKVVRVRETLAVHDLTCIQSEHVAERQCLQKARTSTTQHEGRALATIDGLLTIFEKNIRALDAALVANADRDTRAIAEGFMSMLSLVRREIMRGSSSAVVELEDVSLAGHRLTQQPEAEETLSSHRRHSPSHSRSPQPPPPHPPSKRLFMASPPPSTTPAPPRWQKGTAAGLKFGQSPRIFPIEMQAKIAPMPQQEHRDRIEFLKQLRERLQGLVTHLNLELCDNVTFESKQQFGRQLAALQDQIATLQAEGAGQPTSVLQPEEQLPLRLQRRSSRQLPAPAGNLACLLSDQLILTSMS